MVLWSTLPPSYHQVEEDKLPDLISRSSTPFELRDSSFRFKISFHQRGARPTYSSRRHSENSSGKFPDIFLQRFLMACSLRDTKYEGHQRFREVILSSYRPVLGSHRENMFLFLALVCFSSHMTWVRADVGL